MVTKTEAATAFKLYANARSQAAKARAMVHLFTNQRDKDKEASLARRWDQDAEAQAVILYTYFNLARDD